MVAKQRRGEATITRLLDAALSVHARAAGDGFTVHAVVADSGVSLGSLYHHFGSFDGLAAALYVRCLGRLLDALADAVTSSHSARGGITVLVRTYLEHTAKHPDEARYIHASSSAAYLPAHAQLVATDKAPRLERILAWLRPHVKAGRVVALPEALVEMLVIGPVAETARRHLAGAPGIDLAEAARLLPERIWAAVRTPASRRRAPSRRRR